MKKKKIILHKGLPFEAKIPDTFPVSINEMSQEQINAELEKGYRDMQEGRTHLAENVFSDIRKDYGL